MNWFIPALVNTKLGRYGVQGAAGKYLMSLTMEKVEKRLTDLSGALAHNYPEIELTKYRYQPLRVVNRLAATESGNKISFFDGKYNLYRSVGKISPNILDIFHHIATIEQQTLDLNFF
ncbi:hypothetical protein ACLK2I_14870 [Escherichia coli]